MSEYFPDSWVVLKMNTGKETVYKVLAGWAGGFTNGDSWRMNSGISFVTKVKDHFNFYGSSGSCYECHKDSYRLTMPTSEIYYQLRENFAAAVELMPEDTDWTQIVDSPQEVLDKLLNSN